MNDRVILDALLRGELAPNGTRTPHVGKPVERRSATADRIWSSTLSAKFTVVDDGHYRLVDTERSIEMEVTRLRRDRHELVGELSVAYGQVDGVLSVGSFNLSSPRARQDRAKQLAERSRSNGKIDWLGLLEELCQRGLMADRVGKPATLLRNLPKPSADRAIDVHGVRLFRDHPMIAFGDGGAAKSYLALYLAAELVKRGLTVLYCDWELAADDHRDRLERLYGSEMPDLLYARCDRPLVYEIDRLARLRREHNAQYLVCDSIGFACDGPPEAAEVAGRYFQAVRQLGVGSLHLAHTNRSDRADEKPFGSAFWHNGARSTWFVKRTDEGLDEDRILVGLFNKKANLGRRMPEVGFMITFERERTRFQPLADLATEREFSGQLPLWVRIRSALKHSPQTLASLAGQLDANVESVEKAVRRKKNLFTRIAGGDGIYRVALVEGASSSSCGQVSGCCPDTCRMDRRPLLEARRCPPVQRSL